MTSKTEDSDTIALYHEITEGESAFKAIQNIWNLLRDAYESDEMDASPDNIDLYVDINGHRNEEGGFTADMFLIQKKLFVNIFPAFVDEIHFPLSEIETGDADLETVLKADMEMAETDPNEEIHQNNLDELPPVEEFVKEMALVASYHEESDSLIWCFGDRNNMNDLTAELVRKEIELE